MSRGDHFTAGNSSQGKLRPEGQEGISQAWEWKGVSGRGNRMCKGAGLRDHVGCHWIHSNSGLLKQRVADGLCRDECGEINRETPESHSQDSVLCCSALGAGEMWTAPPSRSSQNRAKVSSFTLHSFHFPESPVLDTRLCCISLQEGSSNPSTGSPYW